jgi:hypothetical protein
MLLGGRESQIQARRDQGDDRRFVAWVVSTPSCRLIKFQDSVSSCEVILSDVRNYD